MNVHVSLLYFENYWARVCRFQEIDSKLTMRHPADSINNSCKLQATRAAGASPFRFSTLYVKWLVSLLLHVMCPSSFLLALSAVELRYEGRPQPENQIICHGHQGTSWRKRSHVVELCGCVLNEWIASIIPSKYIGTGIMNREALPIQSLSRSVGHKEGTIKYYSTAIDHTWIIFAFF